MALTENRESTTESDLDIASKDPTYTRRQFLSWGIYAVAGAVTIAVGVPTVLYFIAPAFKGGDGNKITATVGEVSKLANQTTPKGVILQYKYIDTFKEVEGNKQVFVRAKKPGASTAQDFQILDSTCTHAGCAVSFNSPNGPANKFFCPCHSSVYSVDGTNEKVAPKPLFSYKVELVNGNLNINVAEYTG